MMQEWVPIDLNVYEKRYPGTFMDINLYDLLEILSRSNLVLFSESHQILGVSTTQIL